MDGGHKISNMQKYDDIISNLFNMRDEQFAKFNAKLLPGVASDRVIGIRTPELKKFARQIQKPDLFLNTLPHKYFEENQIHAFILSDIRDFDLCISGIEKFLPYVDNWATCDQLIPKVFAKNLDKILPYIKRWIKSKHTYTVRFAIGLLMRFYLGDKFAPEYADMVANIKSDEYYVNMMRAWYFATALAKNWDDIIRLLENNKIDLWTHNKTIQKSVESYRISPKQKEYLIKLKR